MLEIWFYSGNLLRKNVSILGLYISLIAFSAYIIQLRTDLLELYFIFFQLHVLSASCKTLVFLDVSLNVG